MDNRPSEAIGCAADVHSGITRLPIELLDNIVDYLAYSRQMLINCANTFSRLLPRARYHLYRSLDLATIIPHKALAPAPLSHSLAYALCVPEIGACVQVLILPLHLAHWLSRISRNLINIQSLLLSHLQWQILREGESECILKFFKTIATQARRGGHQLAVRDHARELHPLLPPPQALRILIRGNIIVQITQQRFDAQVGLVGD